MLLTAGFLSLNTIEAASMTSVPPWIIYLIIVGEAVRSAGLILLCRRGRHGSAGAAAGRRRSGEAQDFCRGRGSKVIMTQIGDGLIIARDNIVCHRLGGMFG